MQGRYSHMLSLVRDSGDKLIPVTSLSCIKHLSHLSLLGALNNRHLLVSKLDGSRIILTLLVACLLFCLLPYEPIPAAKYRRSTTADSHP